MFTIIGGAGVILTINNNRRMHLVRNALERE